MALKTDTSVHAKNGLATALDAPGLAPALAAGVKSKKYAGSPHTKGKAATDSADELETSAHSEPDHADHETHLPQATLAENTMSMASLDPTWYAEPGSGPSATDASKSAWFAAPAALEPAVAEPTAIAVAYQTPAPAVPRGPALSPMGSNAMALGLGGLGLGLAAGGGGGGGTAPAPNTPNTPTSTIKVVDGPIRGASVYWDMNDNGKHDAGDTLVGETKADGTLMIATSSLGQHGLLAVGGWNDNGMPNASALSLAVLSDQSAPLFVVSPVTSLVSVVYQKSRQTDANAKFKDAEDAVTAALGIDTGSASLSSLDPTRTDDTGLKLLKAGAVLAGLAAVPQSLTASSQDSLASYVLSHTPTGGALLARLGSSEGIQTVFASDPSSLSATEQATLNLLAGNNSRLMVATNASSLSSTQIAKPQILGLEYDTGLSASDRITSLAQLSIASLGGAIELSVNNGATWVAASNFAPADGDITVRARSNYGTDSAGKLVASDSSEAFSFKLQTTVPPAPTIGLAIDTGVSTADRLTNSSLLPVVSATQVHGSVLQYSLDGQRWSTSLSQQAQTMLAQDGAHTVYVRQILQDSGVASAVNRLDFTLDKRIAAGTAGVLGADDTGALQNDGITTNPQPRLEGRTDPGNTVAFTLGEVAYAVVADGQGYWIFDTTVAASDYYFDEGSTDVALTVTDAAGNTADTPLKITVTLDTELDIGSAVLLDTNVDATEIYKHAPTLRGSTTEIGASVTVSIEVPDATGSTTQTLFFNTTAVAGSDGLAYWSVVLDTPTQTGLVLPMDEDSVLMSYDYSPLVTITDLAGNAAEDTLRDFTLMPGPDAFGRLSSTDTGRFADDNITSHTPITLAGTATPGSAMDLLIDDTPVANFLADAVTGAWTWTAEAQFFAEGLYLVSLQVAMETGAYAGNSTIALPSLTIDTTAPDATAIAGAEIQYSDRVAANTEGLLYFNNLEATGDTVLTFSGAAAEERDYGATLELHLVKVNAESATVSDSTLGTVTLSMDDGSWSYEWNGLVDGLPAAEGSYFMRARATDVAGNSSTELLPVALLDGVEQGFAVDNTAPSPVPGAEVLDLASRTGSNPSYTNLASPTLSGNVAYPDLASVAITVDGSTYASDMDIPVLLDTATGEWSLTLEGLSDGLYDVALTATDLAGNTSSPVALNRFTIDTLPEYFSGDPTSEDPELGSAWGEPVGLVTKTAANVSLLVGLTGTVDPTLTDNLPEGLTLSAGGQLTGTPTTAGVTWLAVHSFDLAGNESITNVQLVVTTAESTKTTVNNSNDAAAKTYSGTTGVDTIKLSASNGDIVLALDGNDTINIANIVNDADTKQLFARVDGGGGIDILNFQAKGESIDFSSFNSPDGSGAVIHGVEQLKFVGASGLETSVTLSAADVFKLGSDAVDLDGNALLVLMAASSASNTFLTASLTDFTQVGETNAYSNTGADARVAPANYSQFHGIYTDHLGAHDVTVLVQGYFILG